MARRKPSRSSNEGARGNSLSSNFIARGELIQEIQQVIRERGWTQSEAADFLNVAQPRISNLMQGRVDQFTVDMLMLWLEKLGKDVSVQVRSGMFGAENAVLTLYVLGPQKETAERMVSQLFQGDSSKYELTIVDVLEKPEKAREARIIATPCLVKESPLPRTVFVGDLSAASIRWQISNAERQQFDHRNDAQDMRQAQQNMRDAAQNERELKQDEREQKQDAREQMQDSRETRQIQRRREQDERQ